jgi:hypothetical protein
VTTTTIRLFCVAMLASIGWQVPSLSADDKPVSKWEYRVLSRDQLVELGKNDLAAGLNKLGNEGWELAVVDGAYIFKRPKAQHEKEIAELKLRIAVLNSDIEMQKDRLAWTSRMFKMGYLSKQAVVAEQTRLENLELVLEKMNRDLERLVSPPIEPIPRAIPRDIP